jgi:hypothetical protein
MEKEFKVEIPDGYEIDEENSTFECIKFKPIKKEFPKTWKEYCKTHTRIKGEAWTEFDSTIGVIDDQDGFDRDYKEDRNLLPNKKYAEATLALCQLIQLRDCYNDGWVPNWNGSEYKYVIEVVRNQSSKSFYSYTSKILAFKTEKLCNKFFENFKNLIEVAKPLL